MISFKKHESKESLDDKINIREKKPQHKKKQPK